MRSPFLWAGMLVLVALIGALVFSDGVAELARFSAAYQRRIQQSLATALRDIQSGSGSLALWTLIVVCFGYGVVHTLGPGHGKAVVVAYFLDGTRPREVRNVEILSYALILLIGFWRLWAGLTGRLHEHVHGADDGHDHHHHRRPGRRTIAGWLLLTAAGIAPCAGALIVVLLSLALGVLWAGILGVIAIAFGMAITLAAIGMASMVAHRLIIGDGRSREIGRFTTVAASLIVIATAGTLLLGALERFIR